MLDDITNTTDAINTLNAVRKIAAEEITSEILSLRPFNSDTCLRIEEFKPKSEISGAKDDKRVSPAITPISSVVTILAIKAKPKTPINVEKTF